MPKLLNILLTSLALSGFIFIGLPHFPAHFAGYFIFLTLLATPFVVLLVLVEIALLLWTKSRWRWLMGRWLRIYYILCSQDWQVQAYQLIENPWSDHKMQLATLNY